MLELHFGPSAKAGGPFYWGALRRPEGRNDSKLASAQQLHNRPGCGGRLSHPRVQRHSASCLLRTRRRRGGQAGAGSRKDHILARRRTLQPWSISEIDPCSWTQSKHGLGQLEQTHPALERIQWGCSSVRYPLGSTTAGPKLGFCCVGDFLASNSTGTNRPAEEIGLRL